MRALKQYKKGRYNFDVLVYAIHSSEKMPSLESPFPAAPQ